MSDVQDIRDDDALVAEYVLRLLDDAETQAFEARLSAEPALHARVVAWEADFASLTDALPEVAPPARVKAALMASIAPARPVRRWGLGWLAFPSVAALAAAAFFFVSPMLQGPSFEPTLHASLASADGGLMIEAGYSPGGTLFRVIRDAGGPREGRDLELWVIADGADAPVSLGLVPTEVDQITFEISPEIAALIDGGVLAVSDEPLGGSPTGAPTGDVLATGAFFDV